MWRFAAFNYFSKIFIYFDTFLQFGELVAQRNIVIMTAFDTIFRILTTQTITHLNLFNGENIQQIDP